MAENRISMAVIKRLPKYHRYLKDLLDKDVKRISSKELSRIIGFTASQIRQDLNNFGGFGQQGYGYNVEDLYHEIGKILGLTKPYNTVIVGAGNLGQALANYTSFSEYGFKLQGIFDINPKLIGLKIANTDVYDMDDLVSFVKEKDVELAFICTNREGAQVVADQLVAADVRGIWNFAPVDLHLPEGIVVENVHLIDDLLTLSYFLKENPTEV